jgi:phosphodiesterase/alkaline phosphatase D-like protein
MSSAGDRPSRPGRRAVLVRAAGLAAAGFTLDRAAAEGALARAVQLIAPAVDWMWSGGITPTTARVRARVVGPGPVRLAVWAGEAKADAGAGAIEPTGEPSPDGVLTFELAGLAPDTIHHYAIETAGGRDPRVGRFRTFKEGALSFAFAFGSCASTGSSHLIFETIRRRTPHFFLHLGDFHYSNIGVNDPARFRAAMNRVLRSPLQAALYREAPIVYVYDDHDYGRDDSDGTSPSKPAVQRVYRERVPHYPLPLSAPPADAPSNALPIGPVAQAFTVGRARVIVTDTRAERSPAFAADPASRTMLGPAQRTWFVEELTRAADEKAPVIFWGNTVPWITRVSRGTTHGWEAYGRERAELAATIAKLGLTNRLIVLSGDAHMAAIDDGTNSNYVDGAPAGARGPVVVQAAPFSRFPRAKGGPYSHGRSTRNHQFGWVEVRDTGGDVSVTLTCHNMVGLVIPGLELTVRPA